MTREDVKRRVLEVGIVPVVRAPSADLAIAAAGAAAAGGIPIVEITMTVPGAIDAIAQLARTMGGSVVIGAGTVLDAATAGQCIAAGARFIVSPGFDAETVAFARREGVLMMAGALTPTEVIAAWKAGSDFVKIFPCGNVGGPAYIRSLKAALPQIPMIPTGGVNLTTAAAFLDAGAEALGVGGELISASALKEGNMGAITDLARQYAAIVQSRQCGPQGLH
jgi:2-dehydro-3-deoxyphosphogluconate aldolase / (4S)-4-hydroxy-2-oxoglutarate aldolase